MKIAGYDISFPVLSSFGLDGGSMFGAVPKPLWEKRISSDEKNRIPMVTRSLLLKKDDICLLVDLGMGEKWDEKRRAIYNVQNTAEKDLPFVASKVNHIIITHLHFDHAGGISKYSASGDLEICYPSAKYYIQEENLILARNPNLREQASYLKENVDVLSKVNLETLQGEKEILPGVFVHRIDGHTSGQQIVEVKDKSQNLFFFADLIPTRHHVPLPYHMGYDMCVRTLLKEKEHFLERAVQENSWVVFQHEKDSPFGKITKDDRENFLFIEHGTPP